MHISVHISEIKLTKLLSISIYNLHTLCAILIHYTQEMISL